MVISNNNYINYNYINCNSIVIVCRLNNKSDGQITQLNHTAKSHS